MRKGIEAIILVLFLNTGLHAKTVVSIATYNLENLFDTLHDEGKQDYQYLPLSFKESSPEVQAYCATQRGHYRDRCFNMDWNENIFSQKAKNLARVIKQIDHGQSPDILVVQEIENKNALTKLRDIGLSKEGYQSVILIEGPDKRGIDVGILSKFPLAERPRLHLIDLSAAYPGTPSGKIKQTRGILEATFDVHGKKITVMGNHWPSQRNPDMARLLAAKRLYKRLPQIKNPVIVTGDFNTAKSDDPNAIDEYILNRNRGHRFSDSELIHFGDDDWDQDPNRGSHFYRGTWSSLDRIFILEDSLSRGCGLFRFNCVRPLYLDFRIVKEDFMLKDVSYTDADTGDVVTYQSVPHRFNPETGEGFSDHLPVVMYFEVD